MKACVLHAIGDLKYEEIAKPIRKPGEVLLQINACGICGSDLPRVFEKGTYHFPTVPGHEFAGTILEADNQSLVGKRATVFPLLPCGKCVSCEIGEYAQCSDYNYFGSRCDGGFAEFICVPEWNLVYVPDGVSSEEAAMCEPAAVAVHTLSRAGVTIGDTVAIFGTGSIGLLLAQWSKAWGAKQVILVDIDEKKLDFARSVGWEHALNSLKCDPAEEIMKLTNSRGADLAIEGAGVSQTLEQTIKSVKPFGKAVLMGNPAGDMHISQKVYWEILRRQLALFGTWNSSYNTVKNDWSLTLEAMAGGWLNVKPLISHRYSLSQCGEAFEMMRSKSEFYNKVMFKIGQEE